MSDDSISADPARRTFIRRGVAAILSTGCFAALSITEVKALLAFAQTTGKPVLTEESLNAFIKQIPKSQLQAHLDAATGDLLNYLQTHFTLSADQVTEVKSMTPADLNSLKEGGSFAVKNDKPLTVRLSAPASAPQQPQQLRPGTATANAPARLTALTESTGASLTVSKSTQPALVSQIANCPSASKTFLISIRADGSITYTFGGSSCTCSASSPQGCADCQQKIATYCNH